jgi:hypothetical protein
MVPVRQEVRDICSSPEKSVTYKDKVLVTVWGPGKLGCLTRDLSI